MRLFEGDCRDALPALEAGSIDAVICDPPYPEVSRDYGRWTEAGWFEMMRAVVPECMRVLKPTGSAVFVLQPNSERVGRMRTWLWEFMLWAGREWGIVQDVWWWNFAAPPTIHCHESRGLTRPSLKACVWVGPPGCYRDQDAVLWSQSEANAAVDRSDRALSRSPSGQSVRRGRVAASADRRGGTTPFNVIPVANTVSNGDDGAGIHGHGAGTPLALCSWWVRYIAPPGGVVLDPFMGSGTVGLAALRELRDFVGVERHPKHFATAKRRLEEELAKKEGRAGMFADPPEDDLFAGLPEADA